MTFVAETFFKAAEHCRAGRLEPAAALCRQLVEVAPRHAPSLYLLGVVARKQGQYETAIAYLDRAIEADPNVATPYGELGLAYQSLEKFDDAAACFQRALRIDAGDAAIHYHRGALYRQQGKLDQAVADFHQVIRLQPDHVPAHFQLGEIHRAQGNLSQAAACYRQVLQTRPNHALTQRRLGFVLILEGKADQAEAAYRRAVQLAPDDADAHQGLAGVFLHQGKLEPAIAGYQRALRIRPDDSHGHNNLGVALAKEEKFDEAVAAYHRALQLEPDYIVAHKNLAAALLNSGHPAAAESGYRRALELMPEDAEALTGLAKSLVDQGHLEAASAAYGRAVQIAPEMAHAHADRALVWLKQGDFTNGWPEYEWRLQCGCRSPRSEIPVWDGSALSGRTILVYAEQGVGDEIMFASCLAEIVDRAAGCVVECDRRLVPLFARSFPRAAVVARGDDPARFAGLGRIDLRIAAGSIPRYLRPALERFARPARYLVPDRKRRDGWLSRLATAGHGLRVGVSWRGGATPAVRKSRSIGLDRLSDLLTESGICLINLQYGDSARELQAVRQQFGVEIRDFEEVDPLEDLDDFAALVSALDLVISVDNSTVHLGGALGVPTWVLLPAASNWRWITGRTDSPWYRSLRLFSQIQAGDWQPVLGQVAEALRELVGSQPSGNR